MAFGRKPKSLDKLLREFMDKLPQKMEMKRGLVLHYWPEVVGDKINAVTEKVKFDGSKLIVVVKNEAWRYEICLLYTSPSPRDRSLSRMPSSA